MTTHKPLLFATLVTLTLSACSAGPPPKLVIDPSMADALVYPVDGMKNRYWGKPLQFGPYHTEKTRVGETWSWTSGIFEHHSIGTRNEPYRFLFVDDVGDRYQVECRAKTPILRRSTRHGGSWTFPLGETKLGCAIHDPAGNVHSIGLHGIAGDYSGETGFADMADLEIGALHRLEGANGYSFSLPVALGYELRQGGRVVASVDNFERGQVYLDRRLDQRERTVAAITLTVLMFFDVAT